MAFKLATFQLSTRMAGPSNAAGRIETLYAGRTAVSNTAFVKAQENFELAAVHCV